MSGELSMMAGNDMTQADFLSRCERSGYLLVLVPSSYLGGCSAHRWLPVCRSVCLGFA